MTSHLDDLNQLRVITIDHRRKLVKELSAPSERGRAQDLREQFLELQTTIEAIDRAIRDEREAAGPWPSSAAR
jgi:hypothetical protein